MLQYIPTAFADKNSAEYKQAKINFSALCVQFSEAVINDLLGIFSEDVLSGLDGLSDKERLPFARLVIGDDIADLSEAEQNMIENKLFEDSIETDMKDTTIDIYVSNDDGSGFIHLAYKNNIEAEVKDENFATLNVGTSLVVISDVDEVYTITVLGTYAEIKALFSNNPRIINEMGLIVDDVYLDLLDKKANDIFGTGVDSVNALLNVECLTKVEHFKVANFIVETFPMKIVIELSKEEFDNYMDEIKLISDNGLMGGTATVSVQGDDSVIVNEKDDTEDVETFVNQSPSCEN